MSPSLVIPDELAPVQHALDAAMRRVEAQFDLALEGDLPPVQRLVQHVETYRGKMLRPMLVVLCGMAASHAPSSIAACEDPCIHVSDSHIIIAAVCEMIHMATLVHDDVLDEADTRRNGATVNRLRGNEAAVILGDYLFSSAYRLCSTLPGPAGQHASILIGQTGRTLCAGELLQLHHRGDFSLDEPTYFEIVKRKTASLIGTACRLGALQSGAAAAMADRFDNIGLRLGVAFQIQDDLLDLLGNQRIVGKPLRKDLALGKLTLPVIHHLAAAAPLERGRTLRLLERFESDSETGAAALLKQLESTGSIDHAKRTATDLVEQAKADLLTIPESPAQCLLLLMADQVVSRAF